jgi:hypothetical protein
MWKIGLVLVFLAIWFMGMVIYSDLDYKKKAGRMK